MRSRNLNFIQNVVKKISIRYLFRSDAAHIYLKASCGCMKPFAMVPSGVKIIPGSTEESFWQAEAEKSGATIKTASWMQAEKEKQLTGKIRKGMLE